MAEEGGAPVEAPEAPEPTDDQAWEEIATRPEGDTESAPAEESTGNSDRQTPAVEQAKPAEEQAGGDEKESAVEQAEEVKWPDPPKAKSKRERLLEKYAREQEQAKVAPIQQQLEQQRAEFQQQQAAFQAQQAKLQQALQSGDLDSYLKQVGGVTVEEYTRRKLMEAGQRDPETEKIRQELEQFKQAEAQRQQQAYQYQQQQAQAAQRNQEITELREELAKSGLPGIDKLAGLDGFTESVYKGIVEDGLEWLDAAAQVRHRYMEAHRQLNDAFGSPAPSGDKTATNPPQPGATAETNRVSRGTPTSLPQSDASEAGGTSLDDLEDDEAWATLMSRVD